MSTDCFSQLTDELQHNRVARILSICGGGLRGIIPAYYITQIEDMTNKRIKELFHLVAGTSTGGLIACGINKYKGEEIMNIYEYEGKDFFTKRWWITNPFGMFNSKYQSQPLIDKYEQKFHNEMLSSIKDYDALITYYDMTSRKSRFFKSHRARITDREDYKIYDVLGCTSAAPTYFPPREIDFKEKIKGIRYDDEYAETLKNCESNQQAGTRKINCIDGGVVANDPALCALVEACEIYPNAESYLLVTIDTGKYLKPLNPKSLVSWGKSLPDICMNGAMEIVHHTIHESGKIYGKNVYKFTISIDIPKEHSDMDDYNNVKPLKELAQNHQKNAEKIKCLCDALNNGNFTRRDDIKPNGREISRVIEVE